MRILLTLPPTNEAITLEKEKGIAQGTGVYPPLGILYVATYLKKYTNYEVNVLDPEPQGMSLKEINEYVKRISPDLIGITAFTNTLRTVRDELKLFKQILPDCVTVVGGPHVSLYPKQTLEFPEVDYAIRGDGEKSFLELATILAKNLPAAIQEEELKRIDGVVFKTLQGNIYQKGFAKIRDLNLLPFPDRGLIEKNPYFCVLGGKGPMTTMSSSRGCPSKCTFCNSPDKDYRARSAANIVDEMEYVAQAGVREIFFFDDTFNIRKGHVHDVCDEILKRQLHKKLRWAFRGRVNTLTDEALVKKLKMSGCERVQLGIEKATDEALKKIKKNITVKDIITATELLHKHKILAVGNFILFTPGEDRKDAEEIIRFSLRLKLDHAEYHVFAPYPGSEIYEQGLKTGLFRRDYWADYARDPYGEFGLLWEDKVPRDEMFRIANAAYRRFYFRPRILWRQLRRLSSMTEFRRKFEGAMTVLNVGKNGASS